MALKVGIGKLQRADSALLQEIVEALPLSEASGDEKPLPLFETHSVSAALVDRTGRVLSASPGFAALGGDRLLDVELIDRAAWGGRAIAIVEVGGASNATDSAVLAYAPAGQTRHWPLPPELKAAAEKAPGQVMVLTSYMGHSTQPLEAACRAYGLTHLQTRIALETIRSGQVGLAAEAVGVSYYTAREAMDEIMRRVQAPKLPAVVHKLASLAFGVLPKEDAAVVLPDLWGLTARQADIAGLVASGLSRAQTARATGLSGAVVKKELDQVYLLLQVATASALARKIVEAHALSWMMRATRGDVGFIDHGAEPLQFVHRADGRRIALSDYGPASGRPVLVVHSSTTTRVVSRGLVRALHAAGYRPIAIDRPGFGLTDDVLRHERKADRLRIAAEDMCAVLDKLKLNRVDAICRGGRQMLELYRHAPTRLDRVVLVNPGMPGRLDRRQTGHFGRLKRLFASNPLTIRLMFRSVAQEMNLERFTDMCRRWLRESPPDLAATNRPEVVRDYFLGIRMFATGRLSGVVAEQIHQMRDAGQAPISGSAGWRVLMAAHDPLYDPDAGLAYWRSVLPEANFRVVEDAGRWMAMSHPQYVIEALQGS